MVKHFQRTFPFAAAHPQLIEQCQQKLREGRGRIPKVF
jgi:hypothetical protein